MRSHYFPSGARWVFLLAAAAYGLAAGAAPVLHLAEKVTASNAGHDHVSASFSGIVVGAVAEEAPGGDPFSIPHAPGDPDCLFCQVLSSPSHPTFVQHPALTGATRSVAESVADHAIGSTPSLTQRARGPPFHT
jgi:hypothetical protein